MKATTHEFWKALAKRCAVFSSKDDLMFLDDTLLDEYVINCDKEYVSCMKNNMGSDVENLDRHKVAAILVIEGLKLQIIKRVDGKSADTDNEFFIGPQKVLLTCAIDYLAQQINLVLQGNKYNLPPMKYFALPEAFSCSTSYVDIMSRLLRNELDADKLFILSLAEKLFLLEYIAIQGCYGEGSEKVYGFLRKSFS